MTDERLRVPGATHVIAVASGKGGVGKSTVAVNLAVGLAGRGLRVGLLDADVHGPNVPLMMGVRRRRAAQGWDAMVPVGQNPDVMPNAQLPPLERYGVKMMSIGLLVGEDQAAMVANVSIVGAMVRNLLTLVDWGELDVLLLDFPPGTSEPQATLLRTVRLDGVIMVINPQDLARLDSTRALGAFQEAGVTLLGVVENMSHLICPHCGERIDVFHRSSVDRAIGGDHVPLLAEIPLDPAVSEAGDIGRPVLLTDPDGSQARAFHLLAGAVHDRLKL